MKSLPIYEDEEDPITGEVTQKLKGYLTKKLSWERTALTNLKSNLDRAHYRSLTPHAKALAKLCRFEGDVSKSQHPMVHHGTLEHPIIKLQTKRIIGFLISTQILHKLALSNLALSKIWLFI